jgi:UDP-glucose 4-epimerase
MNKKTPIRHAHPEPKTILVTGCAGFIGSNFTREFARQFPKTQIIGIDDFSSGRKSAVGSGVVFYQGSICDEKLLANIFKKHKPEYVFHFAAIPRVSYSVEQPVETSEINIIGTIKLLVASKNHSVKRFIFSSSSSIYGGAKKLPTKESENNPDPKSPYAAQKHSGEEFCTLFSNLYGMDTISLRYFNVFGPGQYGDSAYSTVICAWLEALYFPSKKKPFVEGDGTQSRDFCYVDNVVGANIRAMLSKKNFGGEAFNIAHGERLSVNKIKTLIEKYTGQQLSLDKRPARLGDVRHTFADITKAQKQLGYRPRVTFDEGLMRTIDWFEKRKAGEIQ